MTDIFQTLGDFTSKENWDKFFSIRGSGDSFEWYTEWPDLRDPLLAQLPAPHDSDALHGPEILVPGCGSSTVSEMLYGVGFRRITNVDFSKVVVSDMLRRYIRTHPEMKWRVMDMTDMQFVDESFDVVLDKGGLDALMEPEIGVKLGRKYLSEVKRILKPGGKFLCITLAETHVIELLFSNFRFGWDTSVHVVPQKQTNNPIFQTFIVAIVKDRLDESKSISLSFNPSSLDCKMKQVHALVNATAEENKVRNRFSSGIDAIYTLEDLQLGAKGNIMKLHPGQRCQLLLGEKGPSIYSYKAVLLDAQSQTDTFMYHCGVFLVPKIRACEWLFASEEGQWIIVDNSKAARLIMVFLDARHSHANMEEIQKDLSPLVNDLIPGSVVDGVRIPFMMASEGIKQRNLVYKVTSRITGPIIVEDVVYEDSNTDCSKVISSELRIFRRLTFERSPCLVQSEAFLVKEPIHNAGGAERTINNSLSRSKKKGSKKKNGSYALTEEYKNNLKVDHSCLASAYHSGIISGFALLASVLEHAALSGEKVKTFVLGLGAGLLPMFLRECLPFLDIEVVELDPVIFDLAKKFFSFIEDKYLKVHIGDGIQFIQDLSNVRCTKVVSTCDNTNNQSPNQDSKKSLANGKASCGAKIIIIDVDSSDLCSGLTCPSPDFVDNSFLSYVKNALWDGGLFVTNLVCRSSAARDAVVLRMKAVFRQVFCTQLGEDVNEILFAVVSEELIQADHLAAASTRLQALLKFPVGVIGNSEIKIRQL